ncbi:sensor histidine kinase [Pseudoalteromonas ulvae]|uniref:histidine kinase n=1 Tax=Pseudoalteromonas ulvae TaxID=107327 RepID=A0A244CTL1_PSEDV|nr:sensor histidine kinase [Pseudoalteromonas ulvae]OUL58945.1 hypothetical protein B1199_01285 [Pseudoalteromonas ulvae]
MQILNLPRKVCQSFLYKLGLVVVLGSLLLFFVIDLLANHTQTQMSYIDDAHQQALLDYAHHAQSLWRLGDDTALAKYIEQIEQQESTWVAIVESALMLKANSTLSQDYIDTFTLGRDVSWKIHLYFENNPVMGIRFADSDTHFLIQLPARMRPGNYWQLAYLALQFLLPMLLLSLCTFFIYQYVMRPLQQLNHFHARFSQGELSLRIGKEMANTDKEFQLLAASFDHMANQIEHTIVKQDDFIADLSHEVRTPITRIETAVDCALNNIQPEEMLKRIKMDVSIMRQLAEDTLTLAWLDTEQQQILSNDEVFDLIDLLDVLCESARFEFTEKEIQVEAPDQCLITSNSRALGQALENLIRNGLRFATLRLTISVKITDCVTIDICDDGCGVTEAELAQLTKPFYRAKQTTNHKGFGLGMTLAMRQLTFLNGAISFKNNENKQGLTVCVTLPRQEM